jgi:hypothetical protein
LNGNKERAAGVMDLRRIKDWTLLPGATVEIRKDGTAVCSGYVDAVTDDGRSCGSALPHRTGGSSTKPSSTRPGPLRTAMVSTTK